MSFIDPEFFCFLGLFFLGAATLSNNTRLWFYVFMSYLFYSVAYPPYVILLFLITLINFYSAKGMNAVSRQSIRSLILIVGVGASLSLLVYFKYATWLMSTLSNILFRLSVDISLPVPKPNLPVGISFFTFQALSYSIDVYRRQSEPAKSFQKFICFVAFFPQLVAGPIVRSREFLPQIPFHRPFERENTIRGLELVFLGYFKKCVIADNLANTVDNVFLSVNSVSGIVMWFGVLCFAVQIYCDFSGYSDIARGLGRILGFKIPINFRWPYLSISIQEFWRRWHITLSFWIRDYIYISLGGSRVPISRYLFNMMITWLLCGLWHGANITFVFWGLYHGCLLTFSRITEHTCLGRIWKQMPELVRISWTFLLVLVGWALFRSPNLRVAQSALAKMLIPSGDFFFNWQSIMLPLILLTMAGSVHMFFSYFNYDIDNKSLLVKMPWVVRIFLIGITVLTIVILAGQQERFIYFAF